MKNTTENDWHFPLFKISFQNSYAGRQTLPGSNRTLRSPLISINHVDWKHPGVGAVSLRQV